MTFFGKGLQEQVEAFKTKVQNQEEKIKARISALEQEAEKVKAEIADETRLLVLSELQDDTKGQEKSRVSLQKQKQRLSEIEDLIKAYQSELEKKSYCTGDIEKIRATALEERNARLERLKKLLEEQKNTQQQLEQLENKLKQIEADIKESRSEREVMKLAPIASFIDPRLEKMPYYDRERYLRYWIVGEETGAMQLMAKHFDDK